MSVLGSTISEANKDIMSKIWTNGDAIIWLSKKHCGERRNCSLRAISPFPTMFSKAVRCWCVKMSIYGITLHNIALNEGFIDRTWLKTEWRRVQSEIRLPVCAGWSCSTPPAGEYMVANSRIWVKIKLAHFWDLFHEKLCLVGKCRETSRLG